MWYQPGTTPPDPPSYHQQRRRRAWNDGVTGGDAEYDAHENQYSTYGGTVAAGAAAAAAGQENGVLVGGNRWTDAIDYGADHPSQQQQQWYNQTEGQDGFGGDVLQRQLEVLLTAEQGHQPQRGGREDSAGGGGGAILRYDAGAPYGQPLASSNAAGSHVDVTAGSPWPHPSYPYRERPPPLAYATDGNSSGNGDGGNANGEGAMDAASYFFYPRKSRYEAEEDMGGSQAVRHFVPPPPSQPFVPSGRSQHQSQSQSQSQYQTHAHYSMQSQGQAQSQSQHHSQSQTHTQQSVHPDGESGGYEQQFQQQQQDEQQQQPQYQQSQYPSNSQYQMTASASSSSNGNHHEGGANYYATAQYHGGNGNSGNDSAYRQSTLGVNPSTGELSAVQQQRDGILSSTYGSGDSAWAGVGGSVGTYHRQMDDSDHGHGEDGGSSTSRRPPNPPKKKKKKTSKRKSKKDGAAEENKKRKDQPHIADALHGRSTGRDGAAIEASRNNGSEKENSARVGSMDGDDADFENLGPSQGKKRSKKKKKATTLLDLADDDTDSFVPNFDGIEETDLLNAARCESSLDQFLEAVKGAPSSAVAWTMVFLDTKYTTAFLPTSRKYCTEKGPRCMNWNCTCDNQVRGMMASTPIFGAVFVIRNEHYEEDENADGISSSLSSNRADQVQKDSFQCFILPLGPTRDENGEDVDIEEGFGRMKEWPVTPLDCGTSLSQRWNAFRYILMDKQIVCITYNATVSLLPFHYHQENDQGSGRQDLIIPKLFDQRLASWVLNSDRSDADLEFTKIFDGFSHLRPDDSARTRCPANASEQLVGLLKAKEFLEFLLNLYPMMSNQLKKKGLDAAFDEVEGPCQSILAAMECSGIGFAPEEFHGLQQKIESRVDELTKEARTLANDGTLVLSSPQQVSHLLFDVMRINPPVLQGVSKSKSTSSQHRSTSEEALNTIQSEAKKTGQPPHRIVDIVLEFRALHKLLTTYIRPLPAFARDPPGKKKRRSKKKKDTTPLVSRIHPMWMQTAVRTGRLSCRRPNLQQVPSSGAFQINPRNAFKASSAEKCLFACDYSQNEIRILAHMSNDQELISMFQGREEIDIYKQMSAAIKGVKVDDITGDDRKISKQVTLAILYGMGANQVASKLGVSRQMAQQHLDAFYRRFRGVRQWMNQTKEYARRHQYVKTITGRRRYLDDIHSEDRGKVAQAERQAINSVIQGSAADLMKLAMIKMSARIMDWKKEVDAGDGKDRVPPKILLQIHDELLFEVMANQFDILQLRKAVLRCCADDCAREFNMQVPLKLKCSYGGTWGEMTEI